MSPHDDDDDDPYGPAPGAPAPEAAAEPVPPPDEPDEEDDGPYRKASPLERKLVMHLTSALKVSRLHALDNVVARNVLEELIAAITTYLERRDEVAVVLGEGRIFVNGAAMKGPRTGHSWLTDFVEVMERLGVGGLVLKGTWTLESAQQLIDCFARPAAKTPEERVLEVAQAARERVAPPAEVLILDAAAASAQVAEGEEGELSEAERAPFYYARLVALAEASHAAVYQGGSPDVYIRHLRTTLMKIVEHLREGLFQARLLALTAQPPSRRDPLASHAAAVTTIVLAMGRLLGLSRGQMVDLGFAALHHDLGRAIVGRAPSDGGPGEDASTAEPHVALGVALALRGKAYGEGGLLRLIVTHEHHRVADGYPTSATPRRPHLFSRIVAVADAFSNLEVGSPWAAALSPAEALRWLRADPERYEADLVDLLEGVLGRTPRGTLLRLLDGSTVVVLDGGARRGERPVARRVLDGLGAPDPLGALVEIDDVRGTDDVSPDELRGVDWRRALLIR